MPSRSMVFDRNELITLRVLFRVNGVLYNPFSVDGFIIKNPSGDTVDTITPTRVSTGTYRVRFTLPTTAEEGTYTYEVTYEAVDGMGTITKIYYFFIIPPTHTAAARNEHYVARR